MDEYRNLRLAASLGRRHLWSIQGLHRRYLLVEGLLPQRLRQACI
jgi:hypothetical protein